MAYEPSPYQPSPPGMGESKHLMVEGLRKVENALLISIIADLLVVAAVFAGLGVFLTSMGGNSADVLASAIAGAVTAGIIFLLALILGIVSFVYLYRGMDTLGAADPQLKIGSTGVKLSLGGMILFLLSFLMLIPAAMSQSLAGVMAAVPLLFFGVILLFVGGIMLLIAFWRLGNMEDGSLIHIGVILIILGGLLATTKIGGILSFIGTILVYIGVKNLREKMEAGSAAPGPSTTPLAQPGPY